MEKKYIIIVSYRLTRVTRWRCWLRYCATSRNIAGSIPDEVIGFFDRPHISSRTMALGSTQPLTEMSTRNLPGDKGLPARRADNHTAICYPIVWKMWLLRCLTTLWASMARYTGSFSLTCDRLTSKVSSHVGRATA
jgi:hypothetical protein